MSPPIFSAAGPQRPRRRPAGPGPRPLARPRSCRRICLRAVPAA